MNRLLLSLTTAASLISAGCQDSGSSGEYVPFPETKPVAEQTSLAAHAPAGAPAAVGEATAGSDAPKPAPAEASGMANATTTSPAATTEVTPQGNSAPPADSTSDSPSSPTTPDATAANPAPADASGNPSPLVTSSQSGLSGPADRPAIENTASAQPRTIQLLIPSKRFRKERPSNALRVSYDDIDLLKVLNMEPVPADAVSHFPDWLRQLDGQVVRIRGYMYPTFEATGLTSFTLARDNGICCFVRQPKIYDIISVSLAPGEVSDYIANRPFDVEGVFRIDPGADQTDLSRLYRIEQAKVLN